MAIVEPTSGTTIDKADITAMHEELRTQVNGGAGGIQPGELARHSLGPQHVPDVVLAWASEEVTTRETIEPVGSGDVVAAETVADIQSGNWKILANYTLNNGGPGWTLAPCKVFFWFTCDVTEFNKTNNDNQACGVFCS